MKQGNPCVKCGSTSIVYIPGGLMKNQNHASYGTLANLFPIEFRIARYVCASCGFTEEWVDRPDDMEAVQRLAD